MEFTVPAPPAPVQDVYANPLRSTHWNYDLIAWFEIWLEIDHARTRKRQTDLDPGSAAGRREHEERDGRQPEFPQRSHPGHTVPPQPVSTGIVHVTEGCSLKSFVTVSRSVSV